MLMLLLILIFVSSGAGVVALARHFAPDKSGARTGATIFAVVAWLLVWVWATTMEPRLNLDRAKAQGCVSGSELDETLQKPLVIVDTKFGGDLLVIEATGPDQVRVTPMRGGGYATVDLKTGKASAMTDTSTFYLCNGEKR